MKISFSLKQDHFIFLILFFIGFLSRVIPHSWNFTALGTVALVAGFIMSSRLLAYSVPLVTLLMSDLVLGFHDTIIFVYVGFLMMTMISFGMKDIQQNSQKIKTISILIRTIGMTLVGSLLFFAISNFGVWLTGTIYSQDFSGLVACYVAGIPFFRNQILADLILTPILLYALPYALVHLFNFKFLFLTERQ